MDFSYLSGQNIIEISFVTIYKLKKGDNTFFYVFELLLWVPNIFINIYDDYDLVLLLGFLVWFQNNIQ